MHNTSLCIQDVGRCGVDGGHRRRIGGTTEKWFYGWIKEIVILRINSDVMILAGAAAERNTNVVMGKTNRIAQDS